MLITCIILFTPIYFYLQSLRNANSVTFYYFEVFADLLISAARPRPIGAAAPRVKISVPLLHTAIFSLELYASFRRYITFLSCF
jgi:hypothetical protein